MTHRGLKEELEGVGDNGWGTALDVLPLTGVWSLSCKQSKFASLEGLSVRLETGLAQRSLWSLSV